MNKIKNYINRFFDRNKKNERYAFGSTEMRIFIDAAMNAKDANGVFRAVTTIFDYGYVKGYRAAMSEIKKRRRVYE